MFCVLFHFHQASEQETSFPSLQGSSVFFRELYLACKASVLEQLRFISVAERPLIHLWANVHKPSSATAKQPKSGSGARCLSPLLPQAIRTKCKSFPVRNRVFTALWQATIFCRRFSLRFCSSAQSLSRRFSQFRLWLKVCHYTEMICRMTTTKNKARNDGKGKAEWQRSFLLSSLEPEILLPHPTPTHVAVCVDQINQTVDTLSLNRRPAWS